MYRETKSRVRRGKELGEAFWTARGLRQGCPLSPMLFNVVVADLEEVFKRRGWGGVKLGGKKVYTLAYADDMVLMAEDEEGDERDDGGIRRVFGEEKAGAKRRKDEGNAVEERGREDEEGKVVWKGERLEEVKEMKYLGYVLQRNGGQEAQVRDRIRKAMAVMRQVWGIGKRRFKDNWARRLRLVDLLVWPVLGFGAEIWGWKERDRIEKGQERSIRWTMGVDWWTPGYMVREEVQRDKWGTRAGKRAWRFEGKLGEGRAGELARRCWEEMEERERADREKSGWEKERKGFRCRWVVSGDTEWEEIEGKDRHHNPFSVPPVIVSPPATITSLCSIQDTVAFIKCVLPIVARDALAFSRRVCCNLNALCSLLSVLTR